MHGRDGVVVLSVCGCRDGGGKPDRPETDSTSAYSRTSGAANSSLARSSSAARTHSTGAHQMTGAE